jgi:hypothetical protein
MIVAFLLVLIYSGAQWQHYDKEVNQKQLIVYRVNGHHAMEWIDHGKSYFYSDSTLIHDQERIRFHIRPNRIASGVGVTEINEPAFVKSLNGLHYFNLDTAKVLLIDQENNGLPNKVVTDYLIVSNNAVSSLDKILNSVDFKMLILDSSNSLFYSNKMMIQAKSKNLHIHTVLTQGAFRAIL